MKKILICFMVIITISGCATVTMPEDQHFIKTEDTQKAKEGESTVIFYRRDAFVGSAVSYHLKDGDKIIGALQSDSYFRYITEPGDHFFWAENENISSVNINCLADHTHYVEGDISMGAWMGNPKLTIIPESVAKSRLQGIQHYDFDFSKEARIENDSFEE